MSKEPDPKRKRGKLTKVEPIIRLPDGTLAINACADAANADWLYARRLKLRANAGDEEAARELEELENTPMYYDEE